jgi:hypothetical protein
MDNLFGKYCYINTPWIAGEKTRYRILSSGATSNTWYEVPTNGLNLVKHDYSEQIVFVILDTLVSDDSKIYRFRLKDINII